MTNTQSPKKLFTAINLTEDCTKTKILYLGIEVAIMDEKHEQIYFLSDKHGFDCSQLIDLANLMKILNLEL